MHTTGTSPVAASPAATAIMFCSAMPTSKKRSGKARWKAPILVELPRSAVTATMRGSRRPISTSTSPQTSLRVTREVSFTVQVKPVTRPIQTPSAAYRARIEARPRAYMALSRPP